MPVGTTFDATMTRNEIIAKATQKVGGLEQGGTLNAAQLADGIIVLNSIIRELDMKDANLWAVSADPTYLKLVANTARYVTGSTATTIPTNMLELVHASFRDSEGQDWPLAIVDTKDYELIRDKLDQGDPDTVYLQPHATLSSKVLFVHPVRATVDTQSVVTGTDAAAYRCIRSHTADSTNRPVTGANYLQFWEAGGSGPSAWASGTQYAAPQQIRFKYKRPLFDFDLSTDNADMPQAFARFLVYAVAADLADDYALSIDECNKLERKKLVAYNTVFPKAQVPTTNNSYNRGRDF